MKINRILVDYYKLNILKKYKFKYYKKSTLYFSTNNTDKIKHSTSTNKLEELRKLIKNNILEKSVKYEYDSLMTLDDKEEDSIKADIKSYTGFEHFDNVFVSPENTLLESTDVSDSMSISSNKISSELRKSVDNWNIRVIYFIPKHKANVNSLFKNSPTGALMDEDISDICPEIPLFLLLDKHNSHLNFFFSGLIKNNNLLIDYINLVDNTEEYYVKFINSKVHRQNQAFDFELFDTELQERFICFLTEFGINQVLMDLIIEICEYKKKRFLKNWINNWEKALTI